ncbi:MAG: hypothetical protein MK031_07870 [Alphaproteobacteria bacterium]|nr:hypothetical protein [Alphaproteobacteria bacterium]
MIDSLPIHKRKPIKIVNKTTSNHKELALFTSDALTRTGRFEPDTIGVFSGCNDVISSFFEEISGFGSTNQTCPHFPHLTRRPSGDKSLESIKK